MRYVFTLTQADFVALHRLITRRLTTLAKANSKLFIVNLVVWTPLGIAFAAYAALFRKYPEISHDLSVVALAFLLGVGLMIAAGFYKQRIYQRSLLSSNSWFLKQQTVDLDPHRLRATGAYGEVEYPWSAFSALVEDEHNVYLFVDNAQAFVLPKRMFDSSESLAQLRTWVPS